MKKIFLLALILLAGCATPPGQQPTHDDYTRSFSVAPLPLQTAYSRFDDGFRRCNENVKSSLSPDRKTARFDVFWPNVFWSNTTGDSKVPVLGKVELAESKGGETSVTIGVKKSSAFGSNDAGKLNRIWTDYLNGVYDCWR